MSRKKPFYVSLNRSELDLLAEATYEEVALYVTILKRIANFKTGLVGTFQKDGLTYEALAVKLSRSSSQGRPALMISRDRARDLVTRLAVIGLVSNVQVLGKSLVLLLPMSPIDYSKPEEKEATSNAKNDVALPMTRRQSENEECEESLQTKGSREEMSSASVLNNTDQSHNKKAPPQINSTAQSASAYIVNDEDDDFDIFGDDLPDGEDIHNKIVDVNTEGEVSPSIAQGGDIHPLFVEFSSPDEPSLSAQEISALLGKCGILHADTAISHGLYARWIRAGITLEKLEEAVERVNNDMRTQQTPHSVDKMLGSAEERKRRGGVAL